MNRYLKRTVAAATAIALTLMTGCGGNPTAPQSSGDTDKVAMGRYVEQPCAMPDGIKAIYALGQGTDGSLRMVAYSAIEENWMWYISADGTAWKPQEKSINEVSGLSDLAAAAVTPEGGLLLAGSVYSDEFLAELGAFEKAGGGYSEELTFPTLQLLEISPDGSKRDIPIKLPEAASNTLTLLKLASNGDIIAASYHNIYQVDRTTGVIKNTYDIGSFVTAVAVCGDKMAVMANNASSIYDMESGERVDTVNDLGIAAPSGEVMVSTTNEDRSVVATDGNNAFYFCNYTGIYRRTMDGGVVERLVDGSLVSLGTPSMQPMEMVILPDGIMVLLVDTLSKNILLKKYSFDPSVPTLPSKELRIFSLQENKTIRQAVSNYQLDNPDTHVVLEVAEAGIPTADALRTLNTQLLAGKGPDILVLDNMPINAYIEKKVLLPLDDTVTAGMLPNLAEASCGQDGNLYAVPTRVLLPMMGGDATLLETVTDASTLANVVETLWAQNPDAPSPLQNCGGEVLLNTLYPVFADTLYTDGKPDAQKLSAFLEALKRITDIQNPEDRFVTDAGASAIQDISWNAVNWYFGTDLMALGHIRSITDYAAVATAVGERVGSAAYPLSPEGSNVYIPRAMLGVNSKSENSEAALSFIRSALSPQVQGCEFADGLPVTKSALDTLLTPRPEPNNQMMSFGSTGPDGVTNVMTVLFPTPEYLRLLQDWVAALDTPANVQETLLELLRSETAGYFEGKVSHADTMVVLSQKLTLLETE